MKLLAWLTVLVILGYVGYAGAIGVWRYFVLSNLVHDALRAELPSLTERTISGAARHTGRDDRGAYDLALLDPPYDDTEVLALALREVGPLLSPGARVVAKHFWRTPPPAAVGLLASDRERRFGDTALTFYRRAEDA